MQLPPSPIPSRKDNAKQPIDLVSQEFVTEGAGRGGVGRVGVIYSWGSVSLYGIAICVLFERGRTLFFLTLVLSCPGGQLDEFDVMAGRWGLTYEERRRRLRPTDLDCYVFQKCEYFRRTSTCCTRRLCRGDTLSNGYTSGEQVRVVLGGRAGVILYQLGYYVSY